jgi:exonuclease III
LNLTQPPFNCLQINLRQFKAAALNLSQIILDNNIDIILIQEPNAITEPSLELFSIPPGYSSYHSLSNDHAYGAGIIAKSSLAISTYPRGAANHSCGINLTVNGTKILFFSVYLRPSLPDVAHEL